MKSKDLLLALTLSVVFLAPAAPAFAQARGRTDGPEGSEFGKGGYERIGGLSGRFSLELNWGAAVEGSSNEGFKTDGAPIFIGGTATYWAWDWFLLDVSGAYIVQSKKGEVLVGPRFRTLLFPVGLSVGLKAGPIFIPNLGTRFGISPQAGLDLVLAEHFVLGLMYAPDIAIGSGGVTHRVGMNVGYRF